MDAEVQDRRSSGKTWGLIERSPSASLQQHSFHLNHYQNIGNSVKMSDTTKEANQKLLDIQKAQQNLDTTTAAQQSDNVAHALSGAGGGLLAMALTYVMENNNNAHLTNKTQLSAHHAFHTCAGRVQALLAIRLGCG